MKNAHAAFGAGPGCERLTDVYFVPCSKLAAVNQAKPSFHHFLVSKVVLRADSGVDRVAFLAAGPPEARGGWWFHEGRSRAALVPGGTSICTSSPL